MAPDFDEVVDQDTVYQIMVGCREKDYDGLVANTQNAKVTAWWDRAADIIPASGSKGIAIEKVLGYYDISADEALAFGDGTNDIEMLQTVGHGVAMGNATANVKAVADDICGSVQDDGIFTYCKEHNLKIGSTRVSRSYFDQFLELNNQSLILIIGIPEIISSFSYLPLMTIFL